ncbi:EamA family transporter [Neptunicella sp. SCSIO 80796]|uniref:EamA family transporter n=1 Tax=Neptunicella plasticusilytica TaxID=3117012 RepID=UPI003A4D89FE
MNFRDSSIGFVLMALWGFNFSVIKLGVSEVHPLLLVAMRFFFAVFPMIFFIRKPAVPSRYLFLYGLSFGTGVWGLVTWSIELGLSAGVASLVLETSFIFSILVGWLALKEKIAQSTWIGVALATLGLGILTFAQDGMVSFAGVILALSGAFFWAITGLIVKKAKPKTVFSFSVWGMLWIPVPLVVLTLLTSGIEPITALPQQMNTNAWFSVLFQAYPTTLFGYWVWNYLVVKYPLSIVSPLVLLVPVFSLLGSHIFHAEIIDSVKILACLLISVGVVAPQITLMLQSLRQNVTSPFRKS